MLPTCNLAGCWARHNCLQACHQPTHVADPVLTARRFYFDFSQTYVGIGMICPVYVTYSIMFGAVLAYGIMWPLINNRAGDWFPAKLTQGTGSIQGLKGYQVRHWSCRHCLLGNTDLTGVYMSCTDVVPWPLLPERPMCHPDRMGS